MFKTKVTTLPRSLPELSPTNKALISPFNYKPFSERLRLSNCASSVKKQRSSIKKQKNTRFVNLFEDLCLSIYNSALEKGWHDEANPFPQSIALQHSELSEALEAYRKDKTMKKASEKIPAFTAIEEEYADVFIRIMDSSVEYKLRLAEAILAKMEYNKSRPKYHGGKCI